MDQNQGICSQAWPSLNYFNEALEVDRAWVEREQGQLLLEIDGCFFSVPLETARIEGGRKLDEGDLLRENRQTPLPGAWPLEGDYHTRFRVISRATVDSVVHIQDQWLGADRIAPNL